MFETYREEQLSEQVTAFLQYGLKERNHAKNVLLCIFKTDVKFMKRVKVKTKEIVQVVVNKQNTGQTAVSLFKKMYLYVLTYWCQKSMHQKCHIDSQLQRKSNFSFSSITSIEKLCTEKRAW